MSLTKKSSRSSGSDGQKGAALVMPRSRGAVNGSFLALLGLWGALIPFIGPYFNYAFGTLDPWVVTLDRLWLNILPGLVVLLSGLILGLSTDRFSGGLGAWLALTGGIWFIIGPVLSQLWGGGGPVNPIGAPLGTNFMQVLEQLGYFYGLGALITALAAVALGRITMRSAKG
jgi:hypothetical protein